LLRLGGDLLLGPSDPGEPTVDSAGDNVAANCNDDDFVWDRSDPIAVRKAKYERALRRMGPTAFAPFSQETWTDHFLTQYCLYWPAPDRFTPAVRPGATATGMPVLILSGDLDPFVPTAVTRELLRIFPAATFLPVAGAAHPTAGWSECAQKAIRAFVRTLTPPADGCDDPATVLATTSAFPDRAQRAVPATPDPGDEGTTADRRLVTVAVQTVRDAWLRTFRVPDSAGPLVGLRGGSGAFDYNFEDHAAVSLDRVRFAGDVSVTGSSTWTFPERTLAFDVTVSGPRGVVGHVTGQGVFGFSAPFAEFHVTGTVGRRTVHAAVPAN
jgi:hypothetical protein